MARNSGTLALLLATLLLAAAAPSSAQFNFFGTAGGGPRKSGLNLVLGTVRTTAMPHDTSNRQPHKLRASR